MSHNSLVWVFLSGYRCLPLAASLLPPHRDMGPSIIFRWTVYIGPLTGAKCFPFVQFSSSYEKESKKKGAKPQKRKKKNNSLSGWFKGVVREADVGDGCLRTVIGMPQAKGECSSLLCSVVHMLIPTRVSLPCRSRVCGVRIVFRDIWS